MENKKRLIDANKMREDWLENGQNEYVYDTNAVLDSIDSQPTVDAVEVVHGRWVDRYDGKYFNKAYDCSVCNKSAPFRNDMDSLGNWSTVQYLTNYCPNCGAKMDGDGNG